MSDTPETDAVNWTAARYASNEYAQVVDASLARKLERERDEALTQLESLHDVKQQIGFLASDNLGLLKERDQLKRQRDEARKQFGCCSICGNSAWKEVPDSATEECQYCKVVNERDQLRAELAEARKASPEYEIVQEVKQLRAVCDAFAATLSQFEQEDLFADQKNALFNYNQLPHVKERNKNG